MSQAGRLAAVLENALRCSEIENDSSIYSPGSKYRNKFMSDMDQIMYCKAVLRLSGKTQIYTPSGGSDYATNNLAISEYEKLYG